MSLLLIGRTDNTAGKRASSSTRLTNLAFITTAGHLYCYTPASRCVAVQATSHTTPERKAVMTAPQKHNEILLYAFVRLEATKTCHVYICWHFLLSLVQEYLSFIVSAAVVSECVCCRVEVAMVLSSHPSTPSTTTTTTTGAARAVRGNGTEVRQLHRSPPPCHLL